MSEKNEKRLRRLARRAAMAAGSQTKPWTKFEPAVINSRYQVAPESKPENVPDDAQSGQTGAATTDLTMSTERAEYLAQVAAFCAIVEQFLSKISAEKCERLRGLVSQLRHLAGGLGDCCDLFAFSDVEDWDMLDLLETNNFLEFVGTLGDLGAGIRETTTVYRRVGPLSGDALWAALCTRLGIEPDATSEVEVARKVANGELPF
jgi:hypothetical protein